MTCPILFQFWDFINPKVLIKVDELLPMGTVIALTGKIYRHFFFREIIVVTKTIMKCMIDFIQSIGRKFLYNNRFSSCCCNF